MRPHHRTIDEEVRGYGALVALEPFPELPPDATRFPAAEAVVHGIPVAKLPRHIPPRNARACDIEDRLDA